MGAQRVGAEGWRPERWGTRWRNERWRAQHFPLFFPSPVTIFFLSPLLGVLSWNFGGV